MGSMSEDLKYKKYEIICKYKEVKNIVKYLLIL
jgi:hypothetical protein